MHAASRKSRSDQKQATRPRYRPSPIHRYPSGDAYRLGLGRSAPRNAVGDRLARELAVLSLDDDQPSVYVFVRAIARELKIRYYQRTTQKTYLAAIRSLLRWLGRPPHVLNREHVRAYMEYLYDGHRSASDMGVQLAAIRLAWDKMCYRDVTLGLEIPRKKRSRPVIISRNEIVRLLCAARSRRDTLLIGLMYGAGLRVSEVSRLRWRDIDFDRQQMFVEQGKGAADRHVGLPLQYQPLLQKMMQGCQSDEFVFAGESPTRRADRHISPRTVQRAVATASVIAGIQKQVTPHSLRHAFATHSFEDGCDIRRIQKVLGHARLETTTIYVHVAKSQTNFASPLDRLTGVHAPSKNESAQRQIDNQSSVSQPTCQAIATAPTHSVAALALHSRRHPDADANEYARTRRTQIAIEIKTAKRRHYLRGTIAEMPREGFVTIELPAAEEWESTIAKFPKPVRERVQSPEFYQILQRAITSRMLKEASNDTSSHPLRNVKQGTDCRSPID
ncbi:Tyrosine recombinase XerC [Rubripirellula amarantea]|uniref:Tyrosine recombinase XerC n=1 Tax=Rubripirellula amarantea TaxID=2527999 RepID=A0A5C5WFV6_9BACT|nr:tyrosine-type recombinase/integrase [Rubripirellula amarantea]TWT49530.1 Tyrosine recombinase XerC [Rubripirellula amarantea]